MNTPVIRYLTAKEVLQMKKMISILFIFLIVLSVIASAMVIFSTPVKARGLQITPNDLCPEYGIFTLIYPFCICPKQSTSCCCWWM